MCPPLPRSQSANLPVSQSTNLPIYQSPSLPIYQLKDKRHTDGGDQHQDETWQHGSFYGVAVNRAYYTFFYAATALLLTVDLTRSKHSGVLAAFREHFVKPGTFSVHDSQAYGEALELRNVTDYEMLGKVDEDQARGIVENAERFVKDCEAYLTTKGYL